MGFNGIFMGYSMIPSGELTFCYGKIHHFFNGKSTISMVIFNSYVTNYQRVIIMIEL